ncbi:MAG TPA: hypothetical protein VHT34_05765 [Clostridia bacterium]|nr:hypothetical protein [Clostridia bacterium]
MEEGLTKLIFRVAATVLFISALAVFLILFFKTQSVTRLIQDDLVNQKAITDKATGNENEFVYGAQIISSIMSGLETDINVDGIEIPKTVDTSIFNYESIDAPSIYDLRYSFGNDGVITEVMYKKRP